MDQSFALIANGNIENYPIISAKIKANPARLIAVDGGLNHCYRMQLSPDIVVGDLDSAAPEVLKHYTEVETRNYPTEKDETDLELALKVIDMEKQSKVVVYGALGGRLDHTLYNLYLLCRYPERLFYETEAETVFALNHQSKICCFPGQTISLIPLGESTKDVSTQGLKWELASKILNKSFMSISNICLQDFFEVQFTSGQLLCCLQQSDLGNEA